MAKKETEIAEEVKISGAKISIAPLTNNLLREDLNELRDKINEIIAVL